MATMARSISNHEEPDGSTESSSSSSFQSVSDGKPYIAPPEPHLLGLPWEVRVQIYIFIMDSHAEAEESLAAHGVNGLENLRLVCRMLNQEARFQSILSIVKVPENNLDPFLDAALTGPYRYDRMKSLTIEIPHQTPAQFFKLLAYDLRSRTGMLEELKIFGVGLDNCWQETSSVGHPCGKVIKHRHITTSEEPPLTLDGQIFHGRARLLHVLQHLRMLKVLVLDNLNMPVLPLHVLKNKPPLRRLRIGTDPRAIRHAGYIRQSEELRMGDLLFAVPEEAPPLKELDISSNGIVSAMSVIGRVLPTLEVLNWTIPDPSSEHGANDLRESAVLLSEFRNAQCMRILRICFHAPFFNGHNDQTNVMVALREALQLMPSLKIVEVHIRSHAPWHGQDFLFALPDWIEKLFLSDRFFRNIQEVISVVGEITQTSTEDFLPCEPSDIEPSDIEPSDIDSSDIEPFDINDELSRDDFIPITKKLKFVEFEFYDQEGKDFENHVRLFMKLNGQLLDKDRNRHLALLNGSHIECKAATDTPKKDGLSLILTENGWNVPTPDEMVGIIETQMELEKCGLLDNAYFGEEIEAQRVFLAEPVAKASERGYYSLPTVEDVTDPLSVEGHWLSGHEH
ncbi:hypothetical protein ABEF93_004382 [Exophiala dermatitidis]|nr:hypothetical protein HRR75_003044 [Exophiala dermatitidis]KAJ4552098.1 hypothetical protein HRR78_003665 [Exophiala dermatitidis]